MPKAVNQHAEDVKAAVRKTGLTLEALGTRSGVPGATIRKCLYVPCPKGNRVVAGYLGRRLSELWPAWYDRDGNRIPSQTKAKNTSTRAGGHCVKRRGEST